MLQYFMVILMVFVVGVVAGAVLVRILDSPASTRVSGEAGRLRGNDRLHNPEQTEHKAQNLEKVLATPPV